MRVAVVVQIIVALQCCCPTHGQLTESSVRCSAPAAELTKEATVTCLFTHDIIQEKTDFTVRHNQNIVAECMWINGKLDCTRKPGYEFDEQDMDTTSVTLRIPHFLQNHTGQYSCQVDEHKFEICSLLRRRRETTNKTAQGEECVTGFIIIIVSTTAAVITLASVVVIAYIVYRCYHGKKCVRRTDDIQMAETGGHESQNFVDGGRSERMPTPETNSGHQADVTTSLLSEADRSVLHRCCSSIQQEQMNSQCSPGQNRGNGCDCSRHTSAPAGYVTLGNHGKCGGSDVKLSVQGKSVCCEGCPTKRQSKDTRDNDEHKLDDILADDKMFSDEQSSTKKEQVNTPGKNIFYSSCHVCQEKIKVLHCGHDLSCHKGHTLPEEANHDDKVNDLELLPKTIVDMTDVKDIQQ